MLRSGRVMSLIEDLKSELAGYATQEQLRAELDRFATKEDLRTEIATLPDGTAQSSADLRRYMEILIEDLASKIRAMFDGHAARIEAFDRRVSGRLHGHDTRIGSLEGRTSVLETRRPKPR